MTTFDATGERVALRRPAAADTEEFTALMRDSREFHFPWIDPPKTAEQYEAYLRSRQAPGDDGFLICARQTNAIVGFINLNSIVRRSFQSAYLGYAVGARYARQGMMAEAMSLLTSYAFDVMKLHRLEANIQPENRSSLALVQRCGFRREGLSPRYLQVFGQWRDHERWALLADQT